MEIIYSQNLSDVWQEEIEVTHPREILRKLFIFTDRTPKSAGLTVRLTGAGSRAEIMCAYVGRNAEETSMEIRFVHDAPETYGRITVASALFDQAKFMLRGTLEITPRGKGSDTYFSAKALMISPRARAEIYPYLEIQTDEVRASHGTSIGRMDEKQLFYLRSRGIHKEEAEKIILCEYFRDIARELPAPYADKFFQNAAAIEAKPL